MRINQRGCSGFNRAPAAISAEEPISVISAADGRSCGPPLRATSDKAPSSVRTFLSPSLARAVGHPVNCATISSVTVALDPSGLRPPAVVPWGTV